MKELAKLPDIWFEKIQQVGKRGTPDILLCVSGKFVGIELKKSGKEPRDRLQHHKLGLIEKAGGVSFVAYPENLDVVIGLLTIMSKGGQK